MKKALKITLIIISIPIVLVCLFVVYAMIADYKPEEKTIVYESENADILSDSMDINIMLWNIGYCGLSADMDFFYDGGKQVRPSKEQAEKNLQAVKNLIVEKSSEIDFFILQEVDKNSRRSYRTNQFEVINKALTDYRATFGINYKVFFVPIPPTNPYGKVFSGIATYSKFEPISSVRFSLPSDFSWPMGLFMLDRCFLENKYKLENGKELIIINTHNSAYDDGTLRHQQNAYIEKYIVKEYEKGNYVIVGGDWNQCPPSFKNNFDSFLMDNEDRTDIENDFLSDWKWTYQKTIPTNRRLKTAYDKSKTLTTMIDYYLISPNLDAVSVEAIDLNFQNSDHQPVKVKLRILN